MNKLYRSRTDQKLGGVCAGLANYLGIDVTLVRIITFVLIMTGGGFLFYIAAWFVIPLEPTSYVYSDVDEEMLVEGKQNTSKLLGWGLIVFASYMIVKRFFPGFNLSIYVWPLALIAGYWLINKD